MPPPAPLLVLAALACAAPAASAQVVVVGRDSQVNVSWMAGYAADIHGGGASDGDGNLMAIDGVTLVGSDSATDFYPPTGNLWVANVNWDLRHQYVIEGSPSALDDAMRISASGSSNTGSSYSGVATVSVSASRPGNLLALSFFNPVRQQFLFEGSVAQHGPVQRNSSQVVILDETGRAKVTGTGSYNDSWHKMVTLAPGLYTIQGTAKSIAGGNETAWAHWNYTLEAIPAVPEPGSASMLLAGCAWAGLRARRRRGQ